MFPLHCDLTNISRTGSSFIIQIYPWQFDLAIFFQDTAWSYKYFHGILSYKYLQESLIIKSFPKLFKLKHQNWGIKLEKPMVHKLEASRLGHKTGKTHGLQIGSIKIGA